MCELLSLAISSNSPHTGFCRNQQFATHTLDEIVAAAERAIAIFGEQRVLLTPDCGFATFAANPIASSDIAEKRLAAVVAAARSLRRKYRLD